MLLGIILLSTQFITAFTVGVVPLHNDCVEGEPLLGDPQPDVNITVLPSIIFPELSPIDIICHADLPRFPSESSSEPPLPPVSIIIHVGIYKVRECTGNPVNQCFFNISSFFPGLPRRFSCTAKNAQGECRFKTVTIELTPLSEVTTTSQQQVNQNNMTSTTPDPTTTAAPTTTPTAPTTEPATPPIPTTTTAPTTTPKPTDDDDDDTDDSDASDVSDAESDDDD